VNTYRTKLGVKHTLLAYALNPDEQWKLQQAQSKETEPRRRLFKMLRDAFVFNYGGRDGDLIKLSFQPTSLEARRKLLLQRGASSATFE
jgi:hypothetical protein